MKKLKGRAPRIAHHGIYRYIGNTGNRTREVYKWDVREARGEFRVKEAIREEDAKEGKGMEMLACLWVERKVKFKLKKKKKDWGRFQMGQDFPKKWKK